MRSFRKENLFNIPNRLEFVNITAEISQTLRESNIRDRISTANLMVDVESASS